MAGPGHIANPGTLRAQLGRQVPVITGLEQQRQHRGIQRAVSHSMLVKLAHRGQDVVDPARAPDPALPQPARVTGVVLSITTNIPRAAAPERRSRPLASHHPR